MQTFSYLPGPSLRTPGAVWRRNAPFRSIGGSWPWSKIRICVRSRMPMMWPWTSTSSPARRSRTTCGSVIGKVTSRIAVVLHGPVRGHVRRGAAGRPALVVHGDGVEGHVRVGVLDVALQDGDVAAEPHRSDTGLVQQLVELFLQLRHLGVGVPGADRPRDRLLCETHRVVRGAADAHADDPRRARLP